MTCWVQIGTIIAGNVEAQDNTMSWFKLYNSIPGVGNLAYSTTHPFLIFAEWGAGIIQNNTPTGAAIGMLNSGCGENTGCNTVNIWEYPNFFSPQKTLSDNNITKSYLPITIK